MQGWAPTHLTDRGQEQIRRLGAYLSAEFDVDRIITSDLSRTRESAEIIRDDYFPEVEIEEDMRWREQDFGIYQGLTVESFNEQVESFDEANPSEPLPDGEAALDVRKRARRGLEALLDGDETIVVVSHTGPISQVLGSLEGLGPFESYEQIDLDNADLVMIQSGDEDPSVSHIQWHRCEQ